MNDPNGQVRAVLNRLVEEGPEVGLQVAAYLDGRLVLDTWAGLADQGTGRPVDGDTLFMVSSTSKGVAATCLHVLADQGKLDYDAPISGYWPEFAARGKAKATVRDALSHRTGVPQTPPGYDVAMLVDWDRMCAAIADAEPMFEPGRETAYHSLNFGFILGEVLRRMDGRPIAQFLQQEVCRPLGIDSLFFGVPDEALPRVATLVDGPPPGEQWLARLVGEPALPGLADVFNRRDVLQASIPASGGVTNARSLARHYAMLAQGGELDGVRILTPERIRIATQVATDEDDAVYRVRIKRGLGYRLGKDAGAGAGPRAFGHVGGGGSFGYADPDRRFAIGFVKNYLEPPDNTLTRRIVYAAVATALSLPPPD